MNKVNDYLVSFWWRAFDKVVQEKFDSLFSAYSPLLNELGPWRMQIIQAGEEASVSSRSSIYMTTAYMIPLLISPGSNRPDAEVA